MVIVEGVCAVECRGTVLGQLQKGDFFGEMAVLLVHSAKGNGED